jgi:hypothetical protein
VAAFAKRKPVGTADFGKERERQRLVLLPTTSLSEWQLKALISRMSEVEEKLRADLLEAEKVLLQAASLEIEVQDQGSDTLLANARLFRGEARQRYRRALRRFTDFVMGGLAQADVGHLRLTLEWHPDHWIIGALNRLDGKCLYTALTTSRQHGKDVLLEFASSELGRTVLAEELAWIEVPGSLTTTDES